MKFERLIIRSACGLGLLLALTACGRGPGASAKTESPRPGGEASVIRTTVVQFQPVPEEIEIPARIQPDPTKVVRVFPPASGRVIALHVRPGDRVQKGEVLATLASSDVSAAVSDYQKARIVADKTKRDLKRASLMHEHQVLSDKDYLQAQADEASAESDLQRTRTRLQVLGVSPETSSDQLHLLAPRSGVVLDIAAAPGELSKSPDSSPPLVTLADLGTVWVLGDVYEKDLPNLKVGAHAQVRVNAYPGESWQGQIGNISAAIDPTTRTLKVRVVLENSASRLKPEMFASIHVLHERRQAIVLPNSAVLRHGPQASVFVKQSSGRYQQRPVTIARAFDSQVEISSGVKPGESVVVEGAALLEGSSQP